jgi:F-type H+-transporting ATPase subunit b
LPTLVLASASGVTTTTNAPLFLLPNGTFIVELVIFIIVLAIVARVILPPIQQAIRERESKVRDALEAGESSREEADRLERERRSILDAARTEARSILSAAQAEADERRDEARRRGQAEYDQQLLAARDLIESDRQSVIEATAASLEGLVVEAAERIVGTPVDAARHRAAIDRARADLGASNGSSSNGAPANGSGEPS